MISDEAMKRKTEFPHVVRDTNRHGNSRWVYRRTKNSQRFPLAGEWGSDEFKASHARAVLASTAAKEQPQKGTKGSLRWLTEQWKLSSDWALTRPATQRQRENILIEWLKKNGHLPFSQVDDLAVIQGREKRAATPSAANNYLKTMRALFKWAKDVKLMKASPAAEVAFLPNKTDGFEPWTAADVEAFRAKWEIGTRQRVAFEIYYWTGLRRGDACQLGKQHVSKNGKIRLRMEKTTEWVEFTMPAQLAPVLARGPCGDLSFISTKSGGMYTKESLGNEFRTWCLKAGIDKSAHGIRKLAATEAAENGATEEEIDALFGWRDKTTSRIYTRSARKAKMANQANAKRGGNDLSAAPEILSAAPENKVAKS